jgi:uncharacterized membrane protein
MTDSIIYNYLDDDDLLLISSKIRDTEKITSGELCISIKEKRKFFERNKSISLLAEKEFIRLGISRTKERTGILFFLLLKDREFYILADEGINKKVKEEIWIKIKDLMEEDFKTGNFLKGILNGIEEAGKILAAHYPVKPGDINEISNRVNIV